MHTQIIGIDGAYGVGAGQGRELREMLWEAPRIELRLVSRNYADRRRKVIRGCSHDNAMSERQTPLDQFFLRLKRTRPCCCLQLRQCPDITSFDEAHLKHRPCHNAAANGCVTHIGASLAPDAMRLV